MNKNYTVLVIYVFSLLFPLSVQASWRQVPGSSSRVVNTRAISRETRDHRVRVGERNGSFSRRIDDARERVVVDGHGVKWMIDRQNRIFRQQANSWQQMLGAAKDIAVDGQGKIWVMGVTRTHGGFEVFQWQGSNWKKMDGGAVKMEVDGKGTLWVVNAQQGIFQRSSYSWRQISGTAHDIAVDRRGRVWAIGTTRTDGGFEIFRWQGSNWKKVNGGAVEIGTDPRGALWVKNDEGRYFDYN